MWTWAPGPALSGIAWTIPLLRPTRSSAGWSRTGNRWPRRSGARGCTTSWSRRSSWRRSGEPGPSPLTLMTTSSGYGRAFAFQGVCGGQSARMLLFHIVHKQQRGSHAPCAVLPASTTLSRVTPPLPLPDTPRSWAQDKRHELGGIGAGGGVGALPRLHRGPPLRRLRPSQGRRPSWLVGSKECSEIASMVCSA